MTGYRRFRDTLYECRTVVRVRVYVFIIQIWYAVLFQILVYN